MKQSVEDQAQVISKEYQVFLKEIKGKILSSQIKASVAVNKELIILYWEMGSSLLQKQQEEGWGSKTLERLARDLKTSFPNMRGFSRTNLKYSKRSIALSNKFVVLA